MQLYNGEIELEFNEKSHRYKVNGKPVQGVTTILGDVTAKPGLIQWAVDLCMKFNDRQAHIKKRDSAGDIGTVTHKWIEDYIASGEYPPIPQDPQAQAACEAYQKWDLENKPKYLFSEKIVYSKEYNYCGTADVAFELDGKRYLADFKTSDPRRVFKSGRYTGAYQAYPEHFVQCAAYDVAYSEEQMKIAWEDKTHPYWIKPEDHKLVKYAQLKTVYSPFDAYMVIYVTKSGELHTFSCHKVDMLRRAWVGALTLQRALKDLT